MSVTVQWLVGVAAGLTALGVIWAKGVRPLWRTWKKLHAAVETFVEAAPPVLALSKAAPVLLEIANDFAKNGGGSLRDKLDRNTEMTQAAIDGAARVELILAPHIDADERALAEIRGVADKAVEVADALRIETAAIAAEVAEVLRIKEAEVAAAVKLAAAKVAGGLAAGPPTPAPEPGVP